MNKIFAKINKHLKEDPEEHWKPIEEWYKYNHISLNTKQLYNNVHKDPIHGIEKTAIFLNIYSSLTKLEQLLLRKKGLFR